MANSADRDIAMEYISTLIMTDQNFEIDQILQDLNISRDKTGYRFVVDGKKIRSNRPKVFFCIISSFL